MSKSETYQMKRERKQAEAQGRQAAYDSLTNQQKLNYIDDMGFRAVKQRARLAKLIAKETPNE